MNLITTIYEFGAIVAEDTAPDDLVKVVPKPVFDWLERQCLEMAEKDGPKWLRLTQWQGCRAVQVTSFVGVIRAPNGYQIEVLPKLGRSLGEGHNQVRKLLIEMLRCLSEFRHIRTDSAQLAAANMPLLEVFVGEFLLAVDHVVKRGLRSDYMAHQDNLFALRGKLLIAQQIRQNLHRADRFFAEYDEFSPNRPENRLLHSALRGVLSMSASPAHQRLARELYFVFAGIPESVHINRDFQRVRLDRGMAYYTDALAWARLILEEQSPLTGVGAHQAPSLLFPMEKVFEAFVAQHLPKQLNSPYLLKSQVRSEFLVQHNEQYWFQLKPDLLIQEGGQHRLVLDTKWKLLDSRESSGAKKYGLAQGDFYQMLAYGQNYLKGQGDLVLIYPKHDHFSEPLPVFEFAKQSPGLRLWALPFCLESKKLQIPSEGPVYNALAPLSPDRCSI